MQIVSIGDNLHEMSNHVFWENKKYVTYLSSAEFAQRVVMVNNDKGSPRSDQGDAQAYLDLFGLHIINVNSHIQLHLS